MVKLAHNISRYLAPLLLHLWMLYTIVKCICMEPIKQVSELKGQLQLDMQIALMESEDLVQMKSHL